MGKDKIKKISNTKPSITRLERKYVCNAMKNNWGEESGFDYIDKFQDMFKKYIGVKHAIATSSGTGSLHIAFAALGIKSGDEVIVPDATWIASAAPITYLGAKPVFVDVLKKTWCIDPKKIEKAITSKTKAIVVVHLYGNVCEMDEIMAIAKTYNLYVIEDSAEALGSEYKGKRVGSIGDFGIFSFQAAKTITTGQGGMVVTNDNVLFKQALLYSNQGRNSETRKGFWVECIGLKYKMTYMQAALGCAQMKRVEKIVNKKIKIFNYYYAKLSKVDGISMNYKQKYAKNSYWMPTIILDKKIKIKRDDFIDKLNKKGIEARPFFYPISSFSIFDTNKKNKNSYELSKFGINLPSNYDMTKKDTEYVVRNIIEELKLC